jgi:hypothetical protein
MRHRLAGCWSIIDADVECVAPVILLQQLSHPGND